MIPDTKAHLNGIVLILRVGLGDVILISYCPHTYMYPALPGPLFRWLGESLDFLESRL